MTALKLLNQRMTTRLLLHHSLALPRNIGGARVYLAPAGFVTDAGGAVAAGDGWPVADGSLVFTALRVFVREADQVLTAVAPFAAVLDWSMEEGEAVAAHVAKTIRRIGARRPPFAGLHLDRPLVMGIVNVTPDSFSDGGAWFDHDRAIAHGRELLAAGADILDIGGESTRPGSAEVSEQEEMDRILPVIGALAREGAVISVDSRHTAVMAAALAEGAAIVNDIAALTAPGAEAAVAQAGAAAVLMHMQGEPRSMQEAPVYDCAPLDIYDFLADRLAACEAAGIPAERLCVDPGFGFGKTVEHNLEILRHLGLLHGLGQPVLVAASPAPSTTSTATTTSVSAVLTRCLHGSCSPASAWQSARRWMSA